MEQVMPSRTTKNYPDFYAIEHPDERVLFVVAADAQSAVQRSLVCLSCSVALRP
jgi:hypothetical protein